MKSIVKFDKSTGFLNCESNSRIPAFCKNYIKNPNKKCGRFYKKILENKEEGLINCPYGFRSYYIRNNIYTCLLEKGDLQKAKKNIESCDQRINHFCVLNKNDIEDIILDYEKIMVENIELRDCLHDLRNMGGYFNSMAEILEIRHKDLIDKDDDVRAIISLYDLVNYRLNVFYEFDQTKNKGSKVKLHPILKKLKVMLSYQAKKRKINITLQYEQKNHCILSENIYLALFILIENAVKHSISSGQVNINFCEDDNKTIVIISNIGNKVLEEEIPKLFMRGYRGVNAISKGSGLGLNLVKRIFEMHNYEYYLKVEETEVNDRCKFSFYIEFPCEK